MLPDPVNATRRYFRRMQLSTPQDQAHKEIVGKVILRHAGLSTPQRYLRKVNDTEAIRWIETLYG